MEIKEIRHHYVFLEDKAISFGFRKNNGVYFYSHDSINKDMKFLFEYKEDSLFLTCIDKNFNDTFLPFEGNGIKGDFVTSLRKEASSLLGIIKKSCFEHIDIEKEILIYVKEKYKTKPSYPFEDKKTYVFRKKPSRKWFALIQTINLEKLGLEKEDGKIIVCVQASVNCFVQWVMPYIDRVRILDTYSGKAVKKRIKKMLEEGMKYL